MFVKIKMNILWSAGCSKEMIIRLKKSEQKCIGTTGRITGKTKNAFREINNRKVKSLRKALDFLNYFAEKFLVGEWEKGQSHGEFYDEAEEHLLKYAVIFAETE